jgi:putative ABC transport system substrate-binding protein
MPLRAGVDMRRRCFLNFIACAAAAFPLSTRAQQFKGRIYRIGWLSVGSRDQTLFVIKPFEDGLRSLGYRLGENLVIEYRFADGQMDRVAAFAAELVRLGVDVITTGSNANTLTVMKATTSIPIVMTNSVDPVSAGFVASLARPGGNVTGFAQDTGDQLNHKRLDLLKEALPSLERVGVLWYPDFALYHDRLSSLNEVARAHGMAFISAEARGLDSLETAFATLVRERAEAFVIMSDPVLANFRNQIAALAVRDRLPGISTTREYAQAGLLLT